MAEERIWRDAVFGPLRLGEPYPEVGAGLGRLYDVHQVETGRAALLLMLGGELKWWLDGPWQARLSIDPVNSSVILLVEESPPSAKASELTDAVVLVSAVLQQVEDSARLQAQLESGGVGARKARGLPAHRRVMGRRALVGAAMLAMSMGFGLHQMGFEILNPIVLNASDSAYTLDLVGTETSKPALPAYPLPKTPFLEQAAAPCERKGVAEINGGCWVELAQKPPCNDNEAEHQGKCYMPMVKKKRQPQSTQP